MSRSSTLILLGLLIVLVPFSGLPIDMRTFLTVALGISVFGIGFALRTQEVRRAQNAAMESPASSESAPPTMSPM